MGDRVIVTSGLSKAYGIPGVRIGWIVGPQALVADCWSQHDYITIGPNKMSDRIARVAVEPENRERCYARTREILRHNLPIAREWVDGFGGPPDVARAAGRRHRADALRVRHRQASTIAERVRVNQSTLIVPGTARRDSRATCGSGSGAGRSSCGRGCDGSAPSCARSSPEPR